MEQVIEAFSVGNVKPIRDIVYGQLRKEILEGKIQSGERIIEKEYADRFNISRTPVREALRKLEIEGFVEYIPRKGVIVKRFTLKDVEEIYEIRKSLESLAIKSAIKHIDEKYMAILKDTVEQMDVLDKKGDIEGVFNVCKSFNNIILQISSMPRLMDMINNLQEYLERFRKVTLSKDSRRLDAIREHREIFEAIIEKDIEKAQRLNEEHLDKAQKVFMDAHKLNEA